MKGKTSSDLSFSNAWFPRGSIVEVLPHDELEKYMKRNFISRVHKTETSKKCVMVIFEDDQTRLSRIVCKKDIMEVKK